MFYQKTPLVPVKLRYYLGKVLPESIYLNYLGRHEKMSIRIWRLIASVVPAKFAILDIGAFEGEFALVARKVNELSEIYAFEPNPDSLDFLRSVCKVKKINVVDAAISNENKTVFFECNSQISAITEDDSNKNTIEIQAITLDSWVEQNHKKPYLIKIDVEDASRAALQGSKVTLDKHRPIMICEILTDDLGEVIEEVLPKDYSYYLINENNGLETKKIVKRYDWRYKNWLFVPKDKNHLIRDFLVQK